jgi:ribosomal protein S18 acetylase RimI-like enzyme
MIIIEEKLNKEEILAVLKKTDKYFIPIPISKKVNLVEYSQKLSNLATHISCRIENELIGFTCCYMNNFDNKIAFISLTTILPNFIGKGIGTKLTLKCEDIIRNKGFIGVEFEVEKENLQSIIMHQKIDYQIISESECCFILRKLLL